MGSYSSVISRVTIIRALGIWGVLVFGVEDLAECVHTLKAVRPYSLRPFLLF